MATHVENIVVALRAKLGGFGAKMRTAGGAIRGMMKRAGDGIKVMAKFGVGIAAAAAAAGAALVGLAAKFAGGMDATAKLADRLGTTTETLVGLRHAADLAGMSDGELDNNMEMYSRRLGEAMQGTGEAGAALDRLGLSADAMAALPLDEQMARISDAMRGVAAPAERAAIANDLFGRSGGKMITMLNAGGDAIRANMAEAEALGLTYDRTSAGMAEGFNDAMTRVKAAVKGAGQGIATGLMPFLLTASEKMAEFAATVIPYIVEGVKWFIAALVKGFTWGEAVVVNWKDALVIAFKGVLLAAVKVWENIKHFFVAVLPPLLAWVGDNWPGIFVDIYNAVKTIVANMWTNVKGFFKAVMAWLKGDGFDFEWTGLLDGFNATVDKLPAIAARAKTELETSLEADIAKRAGNISDYYEQRLAERTRDLETQREEVADAVAAAAAPVAAAVNVEAAETAAADTGAAGGTAGAVLGRAMSLAALASGAQRKDPTQEAIKDSSAATADALDRIESKIAAGGVVFTG